MTTRPDPMPLFENPWMYNFRILTDDQLRHIRQRLTSRDTAQWQGIELAAIEAARLACNDEVARRGLA